jgi:paired amphipathic helix protein Sin3a
VEPRPTPPESLKRPLQPGRMQPPAKKPKTGVLKDVSLSEATRYGSLNEFAFFDKVRKALKNSEVYENFLRCLVLYNQEIVSRPELVQLISPFLSKHPELLKWFKDFVGFREGGSVVMEHAVMTPGDHQRARQERVSGDTAMEIDYASCKRLGASYCALPRNFVQPKCSGRIPGTICKEVLNDTWVSFPSWSEDSQFVSSRKTQYEEHIYRTEDERFEFDVVLETNRDTIKVLECVQKKMARMPPEEAARYRLDDCLGGTSPTIHQRAIRRIYGDKAADILDGLKRNPVVAVPIVLKRLKAKDSEWRDVQKQFNKVWRDQNEKYYLKSLDHQGMIFKQNDIRAIRSKSLLNEIETLYDEQHEQMEQVGSSLVSGVPHLTLSYKDKAVLEDASLLLIHHVKRQTSIHKEDKQKIKVLLKQSLPDMFFHPRQDMSDTESEKDDEDSEKDDSDGDDKGKKKKDKEDAKDVSVKEEEVMAEIKDGELPPHAKSVESTESYSLLMANNHWYLFLRLHNTLCERLATMYDHSLVIAAEEGEDSGGRSETTAAALRLKPKAGLSPTDYYPAFKDMVLSVLDGNMDSIAYEDTLREMFGIHAFKAFTLDKVIANCVRQLQHLVTDESSLECWDLYNAEKKNNGTGGEVSTADKSYS